MKKLIFFILFIFSFSFSESFCIKVENNVFIDDPFIYSYTLQKVQKIFLEAKKDLSCDKDSKTVIASINKFENNPIGFSPYQRANFYSLDVLINLRIGKDSKTYEQTSFYSLPSGSFGNLQRREAFESLMDRIGFLMLHDIKSLK